MYKKFFKRIFDFISSLLGLVILSPLYLIIAFLIKLNDGGSIFFRQKRVGKNGKIFKIYKFRTMIENAEKLGPQITKGNDKRITKIGRFLRKYKLDELPQLINVLKGDTSIVGPRPEVPKYVNAMKKDYEKILTLRPGLTDYAALEFINEEELLKNADNSEKTYIEKILPEKIKYYNKYLAEISFLTDVKIIIKTFFKILN